MYRLFSDYRDQDKNPYSIFLCIAILFAGGRIYIFAKIMLFREKTHGKSKKQERETAKDTSFAPRDV